MIDKIGIYPSVIIPTCRLCSPGDEWFIPDITLWQNGSWATNVLTKNSLRQIEYISTMFRSISLA
jgi:hypothetical protein